MEVVTTIQEKYNKHHHHISAAVLIVVVFATIALISPAILLAQVETEVPKFTDYTQVQSGYVALESAEEVDDEPVSIAESAQVAILKDALLGMGRGYARFEKQIQDIQRQKLPVPQNVLVSLEKINSSFRAVETAATIEDLQNSGTEDVVGELEIIEKYKTELERLASWPEVARLVSTQLAYLNTNINRVVAQIAPLTQSDSIVSEQLHELRQLVIEMQRSKNKAFATISSNPEEAYNIINYELGVHFTEATVVTRALHTYANLSRFTSESKSSIGDAVRTVALLKQKKVDTTELEAALKTMRSEAASLQALQKGIVDKQTLWLTVLAYETAKQDFENAKGDAEGKASLPWGNVEPALQFSSLNSLFGNREN